MDEDTIYEQWKNSPSEELLNSLIKKLTNHAQAICWKRIPDLEQEHDDIISESVWAAVEALPGFQQNSKLTTWFQSIVQNRINLFLRGRNDLEVTLEGLQEVLIHHEDLDEILATREQLKIVEELPERDQEVLGLAMEGFSHEEIAILTGSTPGAVTPRLSRVRAKLREELSD